MTTAFERITHPRNLPEQFIGPRARLFRAEWRTEAETDGGLEDLRADVVQAQAEMFVRKIASPNRPPGEEGMTWRMSWLEEEMGLPDGGLTGLTDDERRDRLCGRLRSWRLPTVRALRNVAIAYAGNDVQVVVDYEGFWVTVFFTGGRLPPNHRDLEAELVRMMPAWLAPIVFRVSFLTWGDLADWGGRWSDLEHLTWEELELTGRQYLPPATPLESTE